MTIQATIDSSELTSLLNGLESGIPEMLDECIIELGEATFSVSQKPGYVPVRKGTLKKSGWRRKIGRRMFALGYSAPYAGFQEFGTRFMKPRAYLRRAWADVQVRAPKICKSIIEKHIAKARSR